MFKNLFKKLFTKQENVTPEQQEPVQQKKNKFGDDTLENIEFSFDDIKIYEPNLSNPSDDYFDVLTVAAMASQTPYPKQKQKQRDFLELTERAAFETSSVERKQCIAVFEKFNKCPVAYYKISPNSAISMTEFKRKARRNYTDNKKCEYINTRAISLDTYISRLK